MEAIGNLELLKKRIEDNYSEKPEQFEKETLESFKEKKLKIEEEHKKNVKKIKVELEAEEKKVFKTNLTKEQLNAKKGFEDKREGVMNSTFNLAKKRSKDILLGEDYISQVKAFIRDKGNITIEGNYDEYKQHFLGIKINKRSTGVIVKKGDKIYDFTFNTFMESKKLDLRHKISRILFK